jgi:hypothetical protein
MPKGQRVAEGRPRTDSKTKNSKKITAVGLVAVGIVVIMVLSVFVGLTTRGRSSISITMSKTINNSPLLSYQYCQFLVDSVSDDRVLLTDVYLEVKKADGSVGLPRTQLSSMESLSWNGGSVEFSTSFVQYGVAFMNEQNESKDYLDSGDGFILDFATYTYGSVISLSDQSGRTCCSYTV